MLPAVTLTQEKALAPLTSEGGHGLRPCQVPGPPSGPLPLLNPCACPTGLPLTCVAPLAREAAPESKKAHAKVGPMEPTTSLSAVFFWRQCTQSFRALALSLPRVSLGIGTNRLCTPCLHTTGWQACIP